MEIQYKTVNSRINYLKTLIIDLEKRISKLPEGKLYYNKVSGNGRMNYYHSLPSPKRYLSQSDPKDHKLTEELAQKNYYERIKEVAQKELQVLVRFEKNYLTYNKIQPKLEDVHSSLLPEIQELTQPVVLSDEAYARKWENESFPLNPRRPTFEYLTNKSEVVRSKSELLIANTLYEMGIPYRYECPLVIDSDVIIHPDFTILKRKTREVFYHEHLGKIGDYKYNKDFMWRIEQYARVGIFIGGKLSTSFETDGAPINIVMLRNQFQALYL